MKETPWIIADRKIKIAVLGCGRISKNHFDAIAAHKDHLELVAVCDSDNENLKAAIEKYNVKGYSNLHEMLKYSDADVVTICTPSGLHPEHAIAVAQSGRHVITEKPMATRWSDGLRMVKECDAANVRLFVVKQNRRNATLQLLKQAIDKGRFGKIYLASLNVLLHQ